MQELLKDVLSETLPQLIGPLVLQGARSAAGQVFDLLGGWGGIVAAAAGVVLTLALLMRIIHWLSKPMIVVPALAALVVGAYYFWPGWATFKRSELTATSPATQPAGRPQAVRYNGPGDAFFSPSVPLMPLLAPAAPLVLPATTTLPLPYPLGHGEHRPVHHPPAAHAQAAESAKHAAAAPATHGEHEHQAPKQSHPPVVHHSTPPATAEQSAASHHDGHGHVTPNDRPAAGTHASTPPGGSPHQHQAAAAGQSHGGHEPGQPTHDAPVTIHHTPPPGHPAGEESARPFAEVDDTDRSHLATLEPLPHDTPSHPHGSGGGNPAAHSPPPAVTAHPAPAPHHDDDPVSRFNAEMGGQAGRLAAAKHFAETQSRANSGRYAAPGGAYNGGGHTGHAGGGLSGMPHQGMTAAQARHMARVIDNRRAGELMDQMLNPWAMGMSATHHMMGGGPAGGMHHGGVMHHGGHR